MQQIHLEEIVPCQTFCSSQNVLCLAAALLKFCAFWHQTRQTFCTIQSPSYKINLIYLDQYPNKTALSSVGCYAVGASMKQGGASFQTPPTSPQDVQRNKFPLSPAIKDTN